MNERQEHRRRFNEKLAFIAEFEKWLEQEPPRMFLWHWHRWKKRRPSGEENPAKRGRR